MRFSIRVDGSPAAPGLIQRVPGDPAGTRGTFHVTGRNLIDVLDLVSRPDIAWYDEDAPVSHVVLDPEALRNRALTRTARIRTLVDRHGPLPSGEPPRRGRVDRYSSSC